MKKELTKSTIIRPQNPVIDKRMDRQWCNKEEVEMENKKNLVLARRI
jgi:hypothetical protein